MSYSYASAAGGRRAVDAVSFQLVPGEVLAVLGPNGSGKSTLALLANGLLVPSAGVVTVDGLATHDADLAHQVRRLVGVVFQRPEDQIVATSVEDDVAFGPENLGLEWTELRRRVDDALATTGMSGLERREPHLLSGGQKQRLALAGALAMRPRYLVFDEPTSMLDPLGRADALAGIRALSDAGHGVLMITHDLGEALRADRVIVLVEGAIAYSGPPEELVTKGDAELDGWGLALPEVTLMVRALRRRGAVLPVTEIDPARIAEALCP